MGRAVFYKAVDHEQDSKLDTDNLKIAYLGLDDSAQSIFAKAASSQGFSSVFFNTPQDLSHFASKNAHQMVLLFLDHMPPSIDAFAVRSAMIEDFDDLPTVVKLMGMVRLDEMDQIISLKIKRVISEYSLNDIVETIQKYNRKVDLEIEEEVKKAFMLECNELLEDVESAILELETHPSDMNALKRLFRTVHTIKGSSRVVRWREFETYVHAYEELLGEIDSGIRVINHESATTLLQGFDRIVALVDSLNKGQRLEFNLNEWISDFHVLDYEVPAAPISADNHVDHTPTRSSRAQGIRTINVPIEALSKLTFYVSLMLENQKKCHHLIRKLDQHNLASKVQEIDYLITQLEATEEEILVNLDEVRCVALRSVFRPYARIVHDLSRTLAKQIQLVITGEDIRVDNTIASVLGNSLIHLIRNSIDHGIESPEKRKEHGKEPTGTIHVEALRTNDGLTVTVEDDGHGIDLQRVAAQALKRNLYTQEEINGMSEDQLISIIFQPGFSTATSVSSISGRGVGMDMVKNTVESVGGRLSVTSVLGQGSKFILEFHGKNSVIYFE